MILINKKNKIFVDGIIIPIIIFVLITYFISLICKKIDDNFNPILVQGIANTIILCILIPLYIFFNNNNNICESKINHKIIIYAVALGLSLCYICNIIIGIIPDTKTNIVTENVYKLSEELNVYITLFIIIIVVPITEELIFRGFFYNTIKTISNYIFAIIISSIAFAVAHSDFKQILYALIAGLFLAYIKYECNNVIYTIIMHCIMNLTSFFLIPNILLSKKIDIFTLFIMLVIMILSLYRIYLFNISKNNNN